MHNDSSYSASHVGKHAGCFDDAFFLGGVQFLLKAFVCFW